MELRRLDECLPGLKGKKVLVRVDFNVPMHEGTISDDTRIRAHISTIEKLLASGAHISLVSHLGRPKGTVVPDLSLSPVADRLSEITGWAVDFVDDCIGDKVKQKLVNQKADQILLLENVRFHAEETKNGASFAREMASPFAFFVMDAFSASHRAHASTRGVADILPGCAGDLLVREIESLSKVRDNPEKPFTLILGGAKVSDKIGVIENLMDHVSTIIVGGGMAFTFLKAMGKGIGRSLCEEEKLEFAGQMLTLASEKGVQVLLPSDVVVAAEFDAQSQHRIVLAEEIPDNMMGLDIGPVSAAAFGESIRASRTVLWNGPMGVFEMKPFAEGTKMVGEALSQCTSNGGMTVVGGGDTAAAVNLLGFDRAVSHVSTGGGASLEFFEGKMLPGVEPFVID